MGTVSLRDKRAIKHTRLGFSWGGKPGPCYVVLVVINSYLAFSFDDTTQINDPVKRDRIGATASFGQGRYSSECERGFPFCDLLDGLMLQFEAHMAARIDIRTVMIGGARSWCMCFGSFA